jgi:hypothetical protein
MELVPLGPDFGVEVRDIALVDVAASDSAYETVRAAKSASGSPRRALARGLPSALPIWRCNSVGKT